MPSGPVREAVARVPGRPSSLSRSTRRGPAPRFSAGPQRVELSVAEKPDDPIGFPLLDRQREGESEHAEGWVAIERAGNLGVRGKMPLPQCFQGKVGLVAPAPEEDQDLFGRHAFVEKALDLAGEHPADALTLRCPANREAVRGGETRTGSLVFAEEGMLEPRRPAGRPS